MSATAAPDERAGASAGSPKRPLAVTLVALLALGVAVYSLVAGALAIKGGRPDGLAGAIFYLAFGLGVFVAAGGAFRLRSWAWTAFMTWAVIGLTHQLIRYFFYDAPNYVDMAINTFAVLAMSPLEVQVAFGVRHPRNVDLTRPTRNPLDRD